MLSGGGIVRFEAGKEQYEKQNKKDDFFCTCFCIKYLYDASGNGWRYPRCQGSR